jgi:hypothetical protein
MINVKYKKSGPSWIVIMIPISNFIVMGVYQFLMNGLVRMQNVYVDQLIESNQYFFCFFVKFFQNVWSASCPVLVKRVHHNLSKILWHPNAFKLHMIDHRETPALWDCETLTPILTNETILARFWDGFERLNGQ